MTQWPWLTRLGADAAGVVVGMIAALGVVTLGSLTLASYVLEAHENNAPYDARQRAVFWRTLQNWIPVATDGERVALTSTRFEVDQQGCATRGDLLAGASGEFEVSLTLVECESTFRAFELANNYAGEMVPLHVADGRYNALRAIETSHHAQGSWRLRGTALALSVKCAGALDCRKQLEPLIGDLGSELREAGLPLADREPPARADAIALAPVTVWLTVVLPWRAFRRSRRPRWASFDDGMRYRDLSRQVRRATRMKALRRALKCVGWPSTLLGALGCFAAPIDGDWGGLAGSALTLTVGAALLFGARRIPVPPEASIRDVAGTGPRSAIGHLLGAAATATAVWLILIYALIGLIAGYGRGYGQDAFLEAIADPPNSLQGTIAQIVSFSVLGLQEDASLLYMLVILPALAVALVVSSVGQRLRAADVATALRADQRPPILYLRAFAEDALRVPAPSLRRTLSQRLFARRTHRFEEVLARSLARYGPVTAISPPGTRLSTLGAAKANLQHDEWQDAVRTMVDRALLVVVSGTPPEVKPGLAWELSVLGSDPRARLLVVQSPWPPKQLRRNWSLFCAAVAPYEVLAPLTYSWVQPGTHVLAHVADQGWFAWGANIRTDRSYAVAIDEAFRLAAASWATDFWLSR